MENRAEPFEEGSDLGGESLLAIPGGESLRHASVQRTRSAFTNVRGLEGFDMPRDKRYDSQPGVVGTPAILRYGGGGSGKIRAVLTRGFEPPRVSPCAPEAHASASSAT